MKRLALCLAALMLVPFAFACSDDDDGKYSVSAENACNYLVPKGGTNRFEFNFDAENASKEAIAQAKSICVEELNGLPKCKDAIIAEYSCEYAAESKKLNCDDVIVASEECIRGLSDDDQDALNNYIDDYSSKYSE